MRRVLVAIVVLAGCGGGGPSGRWGTDTVDGVRVDGVRLLVNVYATDGVVTRIDGWIDPVDPTPTGPFLGCVGPQFGADVDGTPATIESTAPTRASLVFDVSLTDAEAVGSVTIGAWSCALGSGRVDGPLPFRLPRR
jgi:hypothetical protein